jgi:predicted lipoprotein with Yx(FWY)xxD motif
MEINRMHYYVSKKIAFLVSSVLMAVLVLSGQPMLSAEEAVGVKVAEKAEIGQYLTDGTGMTLYRFANDEAGVSTCTGECLVKWPPFYVDPDAVIEGIDAGDFGVITRDDGSEQTTYKGMPLYYFFGDTNPGDTKGHGVKDVWFAVSP